MVQVRVHTVGGQTLTFDVESVAQLQQLCADVVPVDQQVFIPALKSQIHSEVRLIADLEGGAKKKKKVFTKPKKVPHKPKKIKLRILNLYKIEADGKVTRLRKECSTCGGAYFMASHKDRYYCGNCHKTQERKD